MKLQLAVLIPKTCSKEAKQLNTILGTLVNFLGMRRVNTKGIGLANKCMTMAAIAYNLKKLMKWQSKKVLADIKAIQHRLESAFLMLRSIIKRIYFLI